MKRDVNGAPIRKNAKVRMVTAGRWHNEIGVVHEVTGAHGHNSAIPTTEAIEVIFPSTEGVCLVRCGVLEVQND